MTTSTPSTPAKREMSNLASTQVGGKQTCFDCYPRIVHMAADMSQNLGLQAKLANGLAIQAGLLRRSRRGKLDVFYTEGIERLCNGDLSFRVKEGIRELLALCRAYRASKGGWNVQKENKRTDLVRCSR